jgi:23S rRNA (pseudouridine1915-N3)-methyltransferase
MTIHIIAAGRMRQGVEQSLFDQFRRRVTWPVQLTEVEEKRKLKPTELKLREGERLLNAVPQAARCVVLDERGKAFSSAAFAARLEDWMADGDIAFLIGGADGHAKAVQDRANPLLSLGPATWPHLLIRGLLMEQLYRAQSILSGHPYHRE